MYKPLTQAILLKLSEIVGEENLLVKTDALEPYSHDEVAELNHAPEAVARATTTAQVSAIMKLAQAEGFPVTPRGAGQGLSGGAVPALGGLVLSLERMNRIIEIDSENLIATVEPGVITGNLHRAVEERGLFYPPDPASLDSCSLGGNIAENSGGPRAVKYGVTKDYVVGLEAVLPGGEVISMGGKVVKNVTGYSLIQLLLGSEGTLAIITKILLRLIPLPKERIDLLVPFNDIRSATKSVSQIIEAKMVPVALEFMERDSLLACEKLLEREVPFRDAAAHLLITLDAADRAAIDADSEKIGEICLNNGAIDVLVADNTPTREKLWEARKKLIEAVKHLSPEKIMETMDIVVPRSAIPTMLEKVKQIGKEEALNIISFGHAGDGNVHVCVVKDMDDAGWRERMPRAAERIYTECVALGGQITAEHGVGMVRREYLHHNIDPAQLALMKRIKESFDPRYLLNPAKIFP
jgi:glycolate oxidase